MKSSTIDNDRTMSGSEGTLLANRYRIVRQLGQGGMGSVWLAEDTQLDNKQFAIKMLPSILVSNKRAYAQLKSEALVSMKLVHPNIVQIRAFEENEGNPFLVMDYIDGRTLDDYLADIATASSPSRNGGDAVATSGLSEQEVVRLLKPIAAALDYAHSQGVVHRDVKPGNVMIRKDGTPFILDFGIAREIQETMTRVTGKFSSGTLLYMSPEQLNGDAPKPAQDIYSFAAMAYECLKGEPPFSHGQIEFQIMNKAPAPLVGGPRSCVQAIMQGLAKTPNGRPATCAGVLAVREAVPRTTVVARRIATRVMPQGPARVEGSRGVRRSCVENKVEGGLAIWKMIAAVAVALLVIAGIWRLVVDETPKKAPRSTVWQPPAVSKTSKVLPSNEDGSAVRGIWVEAGLQKTELRGIPDDDGFQERKRKLLESFNSAKSLYDAGQWSKAAVAFTNFVAACKDLSELSAKRNVAKKSRQAADNARALAKKADAEHHAFVRWPKTEELYGKAAKEFDRMEFDEAAKGFGLAKSQFEICTIEAETNRKQKEQETQAAEAAAKKRAMEKSAEILRQAHERKLSEVKVGSVVELSMDTESKRGLVIENASRKMSIRCTIGSTIVTYEYRYDQITSIEVITRGNGEVPKTETSSGGGAPASAAAPHKAPAAPTVTPRYAYEARIVPFVMDGGVKRYVPAVASGVPSDIAVRQENKDGRFEIVLGASRPPEDIIRLRLSSGGRYTEKAWVSGDMFNSNPVEKELK